MKAAVIVQDDNDSLRLQSPAYFEHRFDPFDTALGTLTSVQFEGISRMVPLPSTALLVSIALAGFLLLRSCYTRKAVRCSVA
ncbi:Uncharacterised protein [Halioglobus japonicus]|nr:Uncharacterised protein [Halioglobus japonicus]